MRKVVAIVGRPGSGKSTVAEFLVGQGFKRFGLGDICREEAAVRGNMKPTRMDLQNIGDSLRKKFGNSILSERVWEKIEVGSADLVIVEGSRHPGDIKFLQDKADKFLCLALLVSPEIRYKRVIDRGLSQDPREWEKFLEFDRRDAADLDNPNGQSTEAVIALADYKIDAALPEEKVFERVEEVLKKEGII